jgi:peptidoglycan lytic transglycosylase D
MRHTSRFILWVVLSVIVLPAAAQERNQVDVLPPVLLPSAELFLANGGTFDEWGADHLISELSHLYRMHADVLSAIAVRDLFTAKSGLDQILDQMATLLETSDAADDERFSDLYRTTIGEYERQFGPVDSDVAAVGEIFQVRSQLFQALNDLEMPLELDIEEAEPANPVFVAPTSVPMTINKAVTTAMTFLVDKRPKTLTSWASRAHTWFPVIEKIFAEEGVPDELKYLAMIESGLRPAVRSRASAVGMWQFVAATGRHYGLVIDGWVDERMDPEKATRAAARHLKDLYAQHGDWHIAMSGYNCSPRCLNRARRRTTALGVENPTFWDLYPYLPRETRNYIPQFIATAIMLSNPDEYRIEEAEPGEPFAYDLIPVRGSLALRDVARMAGTTQEILNELNPALRRGYLPPSATPFPLRLPVGSSDAFLEAYANLPPEALRPPGEHIVRRGDTLSEIASTYGVSVSRLRSDNKLRGSLIRPGQRLIVPMSDYTLPIAEAVAEAQPVSISYEAASIRPIHAATAIEFRDQSVPEMTTSPRSARAAAPAPPPTPQGKRIIYVVRSGDTLSEIAEAHGVGLSRVRAWNNIRGSRIGAGKRLVLWVAESLETDTTAPSGTSRSAAYTVRSGDTLSEIARAQGVSIRNLRAWNEISGSRIRAGQSLRLGPTGSRTYKVRRGDTLIDIARTHNISVGDLRRWNGLRSDRIYPGSELRVSDGS